MDLVVGPVESDGVLYGIYLLFTLGCSYYVIYKCQKQNCYKSNKPNSQWQKNKPAICGLLVVICLFWYQDRYRHQYSSEAIAKNTLNNLFSAWEEGNKKQVIKTFDDYDGLVKPWDTQDYDPE